jgi:hypothetical protein
MIQVVHINGARIDREGRQINQHFTDAGTVINLSCDAKYSCSGLAALLKDQSVATRTMENPQGNPGFRCSTTRDSDSIQYPWKVRFESDIHPEFHCEGLLIRKNTILTNARCVWPTVSGVFPCDAKIVGVNPRTRKRFQGVMMGLFVNSKWNINHNLTNDAAIAITDVDIPWYPHCELSNISNDLKDFTYGKNGKRNLIGKREMTLAFSHSLPKPFRLELTHDDRFEEKAYGWQFACKRDIPGYHQSTIENHGLHIELQKVCSCENKMIAGVTYCSYENDCLKDVGVFHNWK